VFFRWGGKQRRRTTPRSYVWPTSVARRSKKINKQLRNKGRTRDKFKHSRQKRDN